MEVAAADVGVDDQIRRLALHSQIVGGEHLLFNGLQPLFIRVENQTGAGIHQHSPAAIVKLQVPASGGVYIGNDLAVADGQILCQLFGVGIVFSGIFHGKGHDHLLQELGGSGNGQLGNGIFILQRLDKLEMLHKGVIFHAYLPGKIGVVQHGGFPVEGQTLFRAAVSYAAKAPHEIQMPGGPAEFTVRNDMIPGCLLLGYQSADRVVLCGLQRVSADFTGLKIQTRLLQLCGAEEASDEIITERGVLFAHTLYSFVREFDFIIRRRARQVKDA